MREFFPMKVTALYEDRGRDDRDFTEWIESQEVSVIQHDQVGMTVDGQLEKFIIRGIAARYDALRDRHHLGGCHQLPQPGLCVRINQ